MAAPSDRQPGNNMRTEVGVLRHRRRAAAHHVEWVAGGTRARSGAVSHAGGEDGRRQRGRVSGAAPVLLPARLHLESGIRLASRVARPRRARHPATARRELAVLPLGERAAGTSAADGRVLSALRRRARDRARARAPLHERRSLPSARRLQDAQHALASRLHRPGDGQRVRVDAAVQAGAEDDGRRRVDDHGLPWRRTPRRSHRSASRGAARVLRRAAGAVGSGVPADSRPRKRTCTSAGTGRSCFRSRSTGS